MATDLSTAAEAWRPIPHLPGYEASDLGGVRSSRRGGPRTLRVQIHQPSGYAKVTLQAPGRPGGATYYVHRLVVAAFYGWPPEGLVINHRDGRKTNNRLANLEAVTARENSLHYWPGRRLDRLREEMPGGDAARALDAVRASPGGENSATTRRYLMGTNRKPWPPQPRLHKPSGQARLRYAGKEYYLGRYGSGEAQRRYAELLVELSPSGQATPPPAPGFPPGPTVLEVVAAWRRKESPRYDPAGGEPRQFERAFLPLAKLFGPLPAAEFSRKRLEDVRTEMIAMGWTRKVINRQTTRIRTVWRWAEGEELAPAGAWAALRALRPLLGNDRRVKDTGAVRPLDQGLYELLLLGCGPALRPMVEVHWLTGMRSGELRRMTLAEVDRSGDVWLYRPAKHKNAWRGHSRVIPLGPTCQRVLAPRVEGKAPGEIIFGYTASSYGHAVTTAAARVGLWGVRPYMLRHGAKARWEAEYGLDACRTLMGHATVETSARYAAERDLATALDLARLCG